MPSRFRVNYFDKFKGTVNQFGRESWRLPPNRIESNLMREVQIFPG